jgi:hypothetical protein
MRDIYFNSVNINSGNYEVTKITHDDSTPYKHDIIDIAGNTASKLVGSFYKPKRISIEGKIKSTTQTNLEGFIDEFKTGMSINGSLYINYSGTKIKYDVLFNKLSLERENNSLTYVKYFLEYICIDPSFAKHGTLGSGDVMTEMWSFDNLTNLNETFSANVDGTYKPKPIISFDLDDIGNLEEIQFRNITTNTQMNINTTWTPGDKVEIDTNNLTVKRAGYDIDFEGVFPEFSLGTNNAEVNFLPSDTLNEYNDTYNSSSTSGEISTKSEAQSFTPSLSTTYGNIDLMLYKDTNTNNDYKEEAFANTTYKDSVNTTCSWNTSGLSLSTGDPVLEYENTASSSGDRLLGYNPSDTAYISKQYQTFTPDSNMTLNKISLYLKKYSSDANPSGVINVYLYTTSDSKPSGHLLTFPYIRISSMTTSYDWYDFSGSYSLTSGTEYALVIQSNCWSGTLSTAYLSGTANVYASGDSGYRIDDYSDYPPVYGSYVSSETDTNFKYYASSFSGSPQYGYSTGYDTGLTTVSYQSHSMSYTANGGTASIEFADSDDNVTFGAFTSDMTTLSKRYIKWKVTLTGDASSSPTVTNIKIYYLGYLKASIYNDSSSLPGTELYSLNIPYSSVGVSTDWISVNLANLSLSGGNKYWLTVERQNTGSVKFYWNYNTSSVYSGGNRAYKNTTTWTTDSGDHTFRLYTSSGVITWNIGHKVKYTKRYL